MIHDETNDVNTYGQDNLGRQIPCGNIVWTVWIRISRWIRVTFRLCTTNTTKQQATIHTLRSAFSLLQIQSVEVKDASYV